MLHKVSVIIPTYNRFDSLITCIKSVMNQTYKNIEIIVVDDNSSDIRYTLLDTKFPHIKIIHLPINMREKYNVKNCQGMTRNVGIDISTGDYIAFLDDDDYWIDPNKISTQLNLMEKYDVLISGTNMTINKTTVELYPGLPTCTTPTIYNYDYLKNCNILSNSTVLVQKDILIKTGCQKIEIYEDYKCWLRIAEITNKILFIPDVTTYYEKNLSQFYVCETDVPKNNNLVESDITIVTCYFTIPSKFNDQIYWEWIKNFLQLDCNLVIYTDSKNYEKIKHERASKMRKTFIHIREIENFYVYKYLNYWDYCKSIDVETNHTPELYMIWAEKSFMCLDAVINNNFKSKYYFWSDIGCIRNSKIIHHVKNFASKLPNDFLDDKFLLSVIENFKDSDYTLEEISPIFMNKNEKCCCDPIVRIQGGFFGGNKNLWEKWTLLYKEEIEKFIKNKTYGGKDQYIMANIVLTKNTNFINCVKLPPKGEDEWFNYLYYLSNI